MLGVFKIGIKYFGAIHFIEDQPIQTRFLSIMYTPIIPLGSVYSSGKVDSHHPLVSALTGFSQEKVEGFPFRRIHLKSMLIAYLRAVCFWSYPLSVFFLLSNPELLNPFLLSSLGYLALFLMFCLPLLLVLGSYFVWKQKFSQEESLVRRTSLQLFGQAFDPLYLKAADARNIAYRLDERLASYQISDWEVEVERSTLKSNDVLALLLLRLRCATALQYEGLEWREQQISILKGLDIEV